MGNFTDAICLTKEGVSVNIHKSFLRIYRAIWRNMMNLKTIVKEKSAPVVFNAKNYRNSPLIREFYRFVAKNGLRAEAFKMLETASGRGKSKISYLSDITLN